MKTNNARLFVGAAFLIVLSFSAGYVHGNRSVAVAGLGQVSGSTWNGYRILTEDSALSMRPDLDRILLSQAVSAFQKEKWLLERPWRTYRLRRVSPGDKQRLKELKILLRKLEPELDELNRRSPNQSYGAALISSQIRE